MYEERYIPDLTPKNAEALQIITAFHPKGRTDQAILFVYSYIVVVATIGGQPLFEFLGTGIGITLVVWTLLYAISYLGFFIRKNSSQTKSLDVYNKRFN
jgi:hypothetical protein